VLIAPDAIVIHRPELALKMLNVITGWVPIESLIGELLSAILGADAGPVIEAAISSANSNRQRALLVEHSKLKRSQEEVELIEAILLLFLVGQRKRNRLVHWRSGICHQLPQAVVMMNPADHWRWIVETDGWKERVRLDAEGIGRPPGPPYNKIMVYFETDFEQMLEEADELVNAGDRLTFLLRWGLPGPGTVYSKLLALPRFAKALAKTRANQRAE
jgi:hypothetical protein